MFVLQTKAQDSIPSFSYKILDTKNAVLVYRDDNGKPDKTVFKFWNKKFWFYLVPNTTAEDDDNTQYVQIIIGNGTNAPTIKPRDPNVAIEISADDFNQLLWIKKDDFDKKAVNNFPGFASQLTYGALTVPFRIRPSLGDHPSTIFNGDFNVGFFFGERFAFPNKKFGISAVISTGVSSLNQNSSNNSGIKDTTSQSMMAITYGGGIIFDWADKLQLGIIAGGDNGFDKLSKTYVYQNKLWFAFSLNYKFLDYKAKDAPTKQ